MYSQFILWEGKPFDDADAERAGRVFRPDIYRKALRGTGDLLPGASSKVEGSIDGPLAVGAEQGEITLSSNRFFDGRIFDPDSIEDYVSTQR